VGDDARFRAARDEASGGRPARGEDSWGGGARAAYLAAAARSKAARETLGGPRQFEGSRGEGPVHPAGSFGAPPPVAGAGTLQAMLARRLVPGAGTRSRPHVSHARIAGELRREHRAHDHVSEARAPRSEGSSRASLETARKRSGMVVRVLVGERGGLRARHPPGCTIHTGERARAGRGHAVRVPGAALLDARASLLARARFAPREGDVVLARERVRPNTGTPRFFARIATYGLARRAIFQLRDAK